MVHVIGLSGLASIIHTRSRYMAPFRHFLHEVQPFIPIPDLLSSMVTTGTNAFFLNSLSITKGTLKLVSGNLRKVLSYIR
jgi:hypothetical protein